jgi:predicted DNA-binding transcriptional regulator AlpA
MTEIIVTDLLEVLREGLEDHEMMAMGHVIFNHAADHIEQLQEKLKHSEYILKETKEGYDLLYKHRDKAVLEYHRLMDALSREQSRSERIGTHGPGCWAWGHQHYECAMQEIKRLTEEIGSLQIGVRMSEVIEPSPEKMLKADEAYRFLGMPRSTFYSNVKLGHLPQPYYITHGSPRWKLGELEAAKRGVRNER